MFLVLDKGDCMMKIAGLLAGIFLVISVSAHATEAPVKVLLSPSDFPHGLILAQKTATIAELFGDHTGKFGKEVARLINKHPCIRLRDLSSAYQKFSTMIFAAPDVVSNVMTVTLTVTANPRGCF